MHEAMREADEDPGLFILSPEKGEALRRELDEMNMTAVFESVDGVMRVSMPVHALIKIFDVPVQVSVLQDGARLYSKKEADAAAEELLRDGRPPMPLED